MLPFFLVFDLPDVLEHLVLQIVEAPRLQPQQLLLYPRVLVSILGHHAAVDGVFHLQFVFGDLFEVERSLL